MMKNPDKKEDSLDKQKHAGGRPSLWVNPEIVKKLIDEYFQNQKRPTLAGLAVSLGISRSTLYNYAEKDQFLDIIKAAREKVEAIYEERMIFESQPTGVIFALKNMGWSDRQEIDHRTLGEPINGFNYQLPVKPVDDSNDQAPL